MGLGNNEKKVRRVWTGVYSGELFWLLCFNPSLTLLCLPSASAVRRLTLRDTYLFFSSQLVTTRDYVLESKFVYSFQHYVDAKIWEAKAFGDLAKI